VKDYRLMKNRGITLIALVVTIIVLLVLAGISISMLTGQNGILNRASEAKEKTEIASVDEQRKLAQAEALMNTEKTTYKGLTLPEGFAPTKIDGEDSIDEGLVITDGYGNEYVWVEVPKTTEVYPTAGLNIINFTDDEYTKVENDLLTYTNDYKKTNYSDIYAPDITTGWFANETEYNEAKKKMLRSVYQNGGFWVGRYEAGSYEDRTTNTEDFTTPLSKKNVYPYNWITRTQAKILAEKVDTGSCNSSLMFGIQWNLMMKYIETKNVMKVSDIKNKLKSDSTTIGNCCNSEIKLNRGKYIVMTDWHIDKEWNEYSVNKIGYVENKQKKTLNTGSGILMTTGSSEVTMLQNIYDISGNVWEWTLEYRKYNEDDQEVYPCTGRGGSAFNSGIEYSISSFYSFLVDFKYFHTGFRVSIY